MNNSERGSVLVLILIAVALFALLAFAVAQGGRDSTTSLSDDQQKLLATEIIDYGNAVKSAASMLRLRGLAANAIGFDAPGVGNYSVTPTAEIFNEAGGAVVYKVPAPEALSTTTGALNFSSADEVAQIGSTCGGVTCTETILWLKNINPAVCAEINTLLGVDNDGTVPPTSAAAMDITGTAAGYNTILTGAPFTAQSAACATFSASSTNAYYQVLLAR